MPNIQEERLAKNLPFLKVEWENSHLLTPHLYSGGYIPFTTHIDEDDSNVYISIEAPNVDPNTCSLSYQNGVISLLSSENPHLNKNIEIGQNLNTKKTAVNYSNNTLFIQIPKNEDTPHSINLKNLQNDAL
ncbi:hypothetical protein DID78_06105 [Candidatus Marinamargulisbacteria bacterium SCGC AG-343-D04]|nr:hypothetical protein DID78_06105 [Candidatus Marinamargulisbacteria bacterium SCGC AG-343-D04]